VQANAGIGFAIPSAIVQKVVPSLIETGSYEHPWLGISGTTLSPDLAEAMGLDADQRGALVIDVTADSPADRAGLRGSDRQAEIEGQTVRVGGDVIVGVDDQAVKEFDDLITYLVRSTEVGQTIQLNVLRAGKEESVSLTLEARPKSQAQNSQPEDQTESGAYLGIVGLTVTSEVAQAMDLPAGQEGVLVEQVQQASPADEAGLRGSFQPVTINGQRVLVGGDVIVAIDDQPVVSFQGLSAFLQQAEPDQEVTLTLLRDGSQVEVSVTLAARVG
jgi:S1-C subfamily serine protease